MSLTLNQFLFLVITICIVVSVAFLVALIVQLRKTAKEGEETLVEIRDLIENLKETDKKVNAKIDDLTPVLEATKQLLPEYLISPGSSLQKSLNPPPNTGLIYFPYFDLVGDT